MRVPRVATVPSPASATSAGESDRVPPEGA
jgi:hypothetical protein